MCNFNIKIEQRPVLGPEEVINAEKMAQMLRALPLEWGKLKLNDYAFYAPGWDGWKKIIDYLRPRVPSYIAERRDCEFMAAWFYVHCCEDFKVNTAAMVQGWADVGRGYKERHAWNIFTDGQYFYQLEIMNGVVMDIDDPLYVPDEIIMG